MRNIGGPGGKRHILSTPGQPTIVATASNPSQSVGPSTTMSLSDGTCANGDIIVVGIGYNSTSVTSFSFSNGTWNTIRAPVANGSTHWATYATYWHLCGSSEPTSYTITASGNPLVDNNFNFVAVEISGANTTSPVNQNPSLVEANNVTSVSGTLTGCTVASNCLPLAIGFNGYDYSAPTCSTGASTSEAVSNDGSGPGMALCAGSLTTNENSLSITMTQSTADSLSLDMLMIASPPPQGPTFMRRTGCGSNSTQNLTCNLTATIATGDIGIVTAVVYNSAGVSISSITNGTVIDNAGGGTQNVLASAWAGAGVSSVTVNTSTAASYVFIEVDEYSGLNTTTPVDRHAAPADVNYAASCSPSALTPTQSGDLAIEYIGNYTHSASPVQGTYSTSPSTTTTIEGSTTGTLALEGWSDYNATGAITGTWMWSTSQEEQCGFLLLNPAGTATPTPSPTPTGSYSYNNFVNIQNGQEFPSNFRPYCANSSPNPQAPCPWNDTLPPTPQYTMPGSATLVANVWNGVSNNLTFPADWAISGDYNHPVYVATSSDPSIAVTCTAYCAQPSNDGTSFAGENLTNNPVTIHIPAVARAAGQPSWSGPGSPLDCHMTVIENTNDQYQGYEFDMYQACGYTGSSFSVTGLLVTMIGGPGAGLPNATNGAALAGGMIDEVSLANGVIPHALFASTNCTNSASFTSADGTVYNGDYFYPAVTGGTSCSSGGPPQGSRLQLTLTDAQIANMTNAYAWEKTVLTAMHDYGVYLLDTQGGTSSAGGVYLRTESETQYYVYGSNCGSVSVNPNPCFPLTNYGSMANQLGHFDTLQYSGTSIWSPTYWVIVDPCYAKESCP